MAFTASLASVSSVLTRRPSNYTYKKPRRQVRRRTFDLGYRIYKWTTTKKTRLVVHPLPGLADDDRKDNFVQCQTRIWLSFGDPTSLRLLLQSFPATMALLMRILEGRCDLASVERTIIVCSSFFPILLLLIRILQKFDWRIFLNTARPFEVNISSPMILKGGTQTKGCDVDILD